jgi:hypothetical protein
MSIPGFAVTALVLFGMTPPQGSPADVGQLAWLAGCWSQTRSNGVVEEHWMAPSGGSMLGMSRTVAGGKTVEYEFLRIADVDGRLSYVARPSGQAEAVFPLKAMETDSIVFENPTHDFPQRIIYRRQADGTVTARIEGTLNGQPRGRDFPYRPCLPQP